MVRIFECEYNYQEQVGKDVDEKILSDKVNIVADNAQDVIYRLPSIVSAENTGSFEDEETKEKVVYCRINVEAININLLAEA